MPYPTSVDSGQVQPWIISNDAVSINSALTTTLSSAANAVYLYAFELTANVVITAARWRMGATSTGTTDMGVYDVNGNLLGHTGAITNVASTNMSANLTANLALAPGQYFMALCPSNTTDTYLGISGTTSKTTTSRNRQATNNGTAGVLPATTGGYSDAPTNVPAMSLTISGGLT